MLTVFPDYYPNFSCISTLCRHNCCIGWEIDIDPATLDRYRAESGEMGRRLKASISEEETPHFILGAQERCPFLNNQNLCDLILHGGEELLCQICADHPRFRSFLPGRTEIGVGLCCEAAARLVLTQKEPVTLLCTGEEEPEDEYALALLSLRDRMLSAAQDRTRPLRARAEQILSLCGASLPDVPMSRWAVFYRRLERLDPQWDDVLDRLERDGDRVDTAVFDRFMQGRTWEYEQLLVYFLFRHFLKALDDGDIGSKAAFSVLSVQLLHRLGALHYAAHGDFTPEDQIEYARMYSAEIEYSEENMDALFDALTEASPWPD